MKVLITGGAGFIGSHLQKRLKAEGHNVTVVDIDSKNDGLNPFGSIDIRDVSTELLDRGQNEPYDVVYHLAAYVSASESVKNPQECYDTNVQGLLQVLKHIKFKRFVFASSAAIYGDDNGVVTSPYGRSKLMGEELVRDLSDSHAILRFFNVYGVGQNPTYGASIQKFVDAFIEGDDYQIYGDGQQIRDYVHVSDVVSALIFAAGLGQNITSDVSTGVSHSLLDVLEHLNGGDGLPNNIVYNPRREGDIDISVSYNIALYDLGFETKVDLYSGLVDLIEELT